MPLQILHDGDQIVIDFAIGQQRADRALAIDGVAAEGSNVAQDARDALAALADDDTGIGDQATAFRQGAVEVRLSGDRATVRSGVTQLALGVVEQCARVGGVVAEELPRWANAVNRE